MILKFHGRGRTLGGKMSKKKTSEMGKVRKHKLRNTLFP